MLIDQIKVRSFRGIRREIELDLRSRLTMIYAPNGVGKTSLCDAVEWLFTGAVYRLSNSVKTAGLPNIFEPGDPSAEARVTNLDRSFGLRREGLAEPFKVQRRLDASGWKKISLARLLAEITPENLPRSGRRPQVANLRNWFRATRFLDPAGLHFLVDSDEEANEVRDLLFSEFLGVGELHNRERHLRKIIGSLGSKASLRENITETEKEIRRVEDDIRESVHKASETPRDLFAQHLGELSSKLRVTLPPSPTAEQGVALIEEAIAAFEWDLDRRQAALIYVLERVHTFPNSSHVLAQLATRLNATTGQHETLLTQSKRLRDRLDQSRQQVEKQNGISESFRAFPFRGLKEKLAVAMSALNVEKVDLHAPLDISSFHLSLAEAEKERQNAEEILKVTKECESSVKPWQQAKHAEQQALLEMNGLVLPKAENLARLEDKLRHNRAAKQRLEAQLDLLDKPLKTLRVLGREFLQHASDEEYCPLCGNHYKTPVQLQNAITKSLAGSPPSVEALVLELTNLEEAILMDEAQLKEWQTIEKVAESLEKAINAARSPLILAGPMLRRAGFSLGDLDDNSLAVQLTDKRREKQSETENLESLISSRKRRLEAVANLHALEEEFRDLIERLQTLGVTTNSPDFGKLPPAQWLSELENIEAGSKKAASQAEASAGAAERRLAEAVLAVEANELKKESATAEMTDIRKQMEALTLEQEEFRLRWRTLVGDDTPVAPKRLEAIRLSIEADNEARSDYKLKLELIQRALIKIINAETRELERQADQKTLNALRLHLRELQETIKRRDECERGAIELRRAREAFVETQIQPLCDVITALYVRTQSAPFINRIDSARRDGTLRWLPLVDDARLEDPAQLSLGQRQDLALSIFLARERELGGTFFLDEPLVHLDDLNRVALMDILRTIVVEKRDKRLRLVLTTANKSLVRHCREKFARVADDQGEAAFRAYRLWGDSKRGISATIDT